MTCSIARASRARGFRAESRLHRLTALALVTTAISSLSWSAAYADPDGAMWTGNIDNNWFLSGNWSSLTSPDSGFYARIDNKTGVTIDGSPAVADEVWIGVGGIADLTVNSSLVTRTTSLGFSQGVGTLTLSAGAHWTNLSSIYLGKFDNGTGFVSVGDRATVTSGATTLGYEAGSAGRLDVTGGSFTSSGNLTVGYHGSGIVNVAFGTLENVYGILGSEVGSSGTVTLDGLSAAWVNTGQTIVGQYGIGTVTVTNGASLISQIGSFIGQGSTATGSSVTITGTGSSWNNNGQIVVGNDGNARLDVLAGGFVRSYDAYIGVNSTSTAEVSGAGSFWDMGALSLGGKEFTPGTAGDGTLSISAGGKVFSTSARLGLNSNDHGTVSLSDAGSEWDVDTTLSVGYKGTGSLTVTDNARVEASWMLLGEKAGSTGSATISNGGRLKDTGNLFVGNQGTGALTVSSGGGVTSVNGFVGTENGSVGTATVTGSGSSWDMNGSLIVAQNAGSTGTMTISDGAAVTDYQGIVGDLAGSVGSLTVTGAGSTWATTVANGLAYSGAVYAGQSGNGTVTVANGGRITGDRFYAGYDVGSNGTVLLSGAGSSIAATDPFVVGFDGTGTATVTDGGRITGDRFYAGYDVGSNGTVLVTGAGSSIAAIDRFVVGSDGTGTATVTDGGSINAGVIKIATSATATGTLNVGAAHGAVAAAAGRLDTNAIQFGAGNGLLEFNFTDPSYVVSAAISGTGKVRLDAGTLTLAGANSYTGGTEVNGGKLTIAGSLSGSATAVTLAGGELVNSGTISGTDYGVRLNTSGNAVTNTGSISGGTAAVFFGAGGNRLSMEPSATFGGLVDYNHTTGNTTSFGTGSYRLAAANYLEAGNSIALNNSRQTVVLDKAETSSGYINVVALPATSQAATQYTASVSDVVGSILMLDVARPDQIVVGDTVVSALQYGETPAETKETKALRMLGDDVAVDRYGNLFWTRLFGGLRYQPSSDGDYASHTSHYGVVSGVDHQYENVRLGMFAGGGSVRSVAGDSASTMTGDTGFLGVYGAVELGGFQWTTSLTGGAIDTNASRTVNNGTETASGDYMGWYVSPELSVSRRYQLAPEWQLTPSAKVRYTGAFYDAYDESGSSQNVSYVARDTHSLDGRLQMELKRRITLPSGLPASISTTAAVSDTQYLGSGRIHASLSNNEFTVSSSSDNNVVGASLGVGFDAMVSQRTSVYGGIDGALYSDSSMTASGRLGVKVAF